MTTEIELFQRGKEILGPQGGGLVVKLLRAKDRNLELAMDALELAATKASPREYVGAMVRHQPRFKGVRGDDWW